MPDVLQEILKKGGPLIIYWQGLEQAFYSPETLLVLAKKIREAENDEKGAKILTIYVDAQYSIKRWERNNLQFMVAKEMEEALNLLGISFDPPSPKAQEILQGIKTKMGL